MFGSEQWMYSSGGGGFYDTEIDGSLRFNDNDSAYLNRTPASAGNAKKWTFSAWVKLGDLSQNMNIFGAGTVSTPGGDEIRLAYQSNKFRLNGDNTSGLSITPSALHRDPSAWYHVVVYWDTANATPANRVKLYINGEQVTDFTTATYPSQNKEYAINQAKQHKIGRRPRDTSEHFDGYLAEVNFIDGQALTADSFGETKSGVWIPKAYSGSYGTNGFHLEFAGNANDSSGNGNNWTANNISSYDYVPDSPTNNFCTINPLSAITPVNLQQGNLQYSTNGGQASYYAGSMAMSSGKWYFEYRLRSGYADLQGGIVALPATPINSSNFDSWRYKTNGNLEYSGGYQSGWATSYSTFDVIGIAVDVEGGTFKAYKEGNLVGTKTGISTSATWLPYFLGYNGPIVDVNFGQDSTFAGATAAGGHSDANGYGDFKFAPPSGYLALCTANLTVAEGVDPALDNSPQDYFNTVLYTGSDGTPGSVSGVGFQPDIIWVKSRGNSGNGTIADALRGTARSLFTNVTNAENTSSTGLTSFDSDGFSYGTSGDWSDGTHVAWNWKESASAGVDIVLYSGTGSARTIAHSLGAVPKVMICKERNGTSAWRIYNANFDTPPTQRLQFDSGSVATTGTSWNATNPTASVFSVGADTNTNESGKTYVMYLFSDVEGFSKFGKYTGNGNSDGPFVYTGMRPAYVLIKRTNGDNAWIIFDAVRNTYNLMDKELYANTNEAEDTVGRIDFTSNGFKIRQTGLVVNASGGNYIYMAFAENPFKYANAR